MQRLLINTFGITLMLISVSCASDSISSQSMPNSDDSINLQTDYESLPFSKIATRLNACIENYQTVTYRYWTPSVSDAKNVGYGYMDSQINGSENNDETLTSTNCDEQAEEISALSMASSIARSREKTSEVYKSWSKCMDENGYPGISDPTRRKNILAKKLYDPIGDKNESIPEFENRGEQLKEYEIGMALADIECQENEILPRLDEIASEQNDVINEAPADIKAFLKG